MNEKAFYVDIVMASERSPLIKRVGVAPRRQRYPHQTLRQFCTIVLTGVLFVAAGFAVFLLATPGLGRAVRNDNGTPYSPFEHSGPSRTWPESEGVSLSKLYEILLTTPQEAKAREWSKYYTSGPHLAGKNLSQAEWTRDRWREFGVEDVSIVAYDVWLNYPLGHRLALLNSTGTKKGHPSKVQYEAKLEEDVLEEDATSGREDRIPTFHGYSASGNVTARYVYVNYGTVYDFDELVAANVSLEGKIALVRYGGVFRGLKLKRAQELGMVGGIIYSDPGDDGPMTAENGYEEYPDGPARQPSSVQRGSVEYLGVAAGDPTTPGYPSKPGVPRKDPSDELPQIPSIPISYQDALPLLRALNGQGPDISKFNKYWQNVGLKKQGVDYNIGPSAPEITLNLVNEQDYVTTPMWDVIGVINGTLADEVIVMGNHRDAWILGGAGDPNSGSAAMNELVRGLGKALGAGWKPLRTIVLGSWDGEEYGLIGSTEWVEEYLPWLTTSAVAYVNVDVGTSGSSFRASAAPLLDGPLVRAAKAVLSPNQTIEGQTVRDVWDGKIATMGSGSDFTAFQDFAGVPCVDMGFTPDESTPIYHYHSNYDSFDWMDRFGDPGWHYHAAMAKVWGALTVELVESPIIPFSAGNYAKALAGYVRRTQGLLEASALGAKNATLDPLARAVEAFSVECEALDKHAKSLAVSIEGARGVPWWRWWTRRELYHSAKVVNNKYKFIERQFLHPEGLDKRSWFKHSVFAPGRWTGYAGAVFPGLVESIEDGDAENLKRWEGIISDQVYAAIDLLDN